MDNTASEPKDKFAFGKNWKNFLDTHLSPETVEVATNSLKQFLETEALQGRSFLDVGCGSGIHSLAALRLGASPIVSVDVDADSVACCERLAKERADATWSVREGSMLDEQFMKSLGTYDIVYCWGVAHHTGDMWRALRNLVPTVKQGGLLFVAIYNTVPGRKGSSMWHAIKRTYVRSPFIIKKLMEWFYMGLFMLKMLIRLKNPFTVFKKYETKRGMSYKHDLVDWLGGYPYEHARAEEIFRFYRDEGNMELINLKTDNYTGNNQLLFRKR